MPTVGDLTLAHASATRQLAALRSALRLGPTAGIDVEILDREIRTARYRRDRLRRDLKALETGETYAQVRRRTRDHRAEYARRKAIKAGAPSKRRGLNATELTEFRAIDKRLRSSFGRRTDGGIDRRTLKDLRTLIGGFDDPATAWEKDKGTETMDLLLRYYQVRIPPEDLFRFYS